MILDTWYFWDSIFLRPNISVTQYLNDPIFEWPDIWVTRFFWDPIFLRPNISETWYFWEPIFLRLIFLRPVISETRYFWDSIFLWPHISVTRYFCDPIFLRPNICETRYFWDPIFLRPDISETRYFWDPIFLRPGISEIRYFWDPIFLRPYISETQYFWCPIFLTLLGYFSLFRTIFEFFVTFLMDIFEFLFWKHKIYSRSRSFEHFLLLFTFGIFLFVAVRHGDKLEFSCLVPWVKTTNYIILSQPRSRIFLCLLNLYNVFINCLDSPYRLYANLESVAHKMAQLLH